MSEPLITLYSLYKKEEKLILTDCWALIYKQKDVIRASSKSRHLQGQIWLCRAISR